MQRYRPRTDGTVELLMDCCEDLRYKGGMGRIVSDKGANQVCLRSTNLRISEETQKLIDGA